MKTFGPFNGRQLTTMFVALLVAIVVAIPAGAWAVSFTNVAITDPGGVNQAKVSTGGALSTSGTATPATPANLVRITGTPGTDPCTPIYTVPAGKALILNTGTFYPRPTNPGTQGQLSLYRSIGTNLCGEWIADSWTDATALVQTTSLDFGAGLSIPAGTKIALTSFRATGYVFLHGYLVASSAVPASVTATPAAAPTAP